MLRIKKPARNLAHAVPGTGPFAAICGAIIAARLQRIPVILDGYVVTAAAATSGPTA